MVAIYDDLIKQSVADYLPGVDWRLLKAQLQAESALDPYANSPVGAKGLAQFMPKTWAQMVDELTLPAHASPYESDYAIPAAAYYMSTLCEKWTELRPDADRYCLALASYNVGFGNMLKAQKHAGGLSGYHSIISHLQFIKNVDHQQTTDYVNKIFVIWGEYIMKGR